jgi:hypothetical protein
MKKLTARDIVTCAVVLAAGLLTPPAEAGGGQAGVSAAGVSVSLPAAVVVGVPPASPGFPHALPEHRFRVPPGSDDRFRVPPSDVRSGGHPLTAHSFLVPTFARLPTGRVVVFHRIVTVFTPVGVGVPIVPARPIVVPSLGIHPPQVGPPPPITVPTQGVSPIPGPPPPITVPSQ